MAFIIGGMTQKLTRSVAAEFSFFLAVPTMAAATGYKLLKTYKTHPEILKDKNNLMLLGLGNVIAFIVAMIAINHVEYYRAKVPLLLIGTHFYRTYPLKSSVVFGTHIRELF